MEDKRKPATLCESYRLVRLWGRSSGHMSGDRVNDCLPCPNFPIGLHQIINNQNLVSRDFAPFMMALAIDFSCADQTLIVDQNLHLTVAFPSFRHILPAPTDGFLFDSTRSIFPALGVFPLVSIFLDFLHPLKTLAQI